MLEKFKQLSLNPKIVLFTLLTGLFPPLAISGLVSIKLHEVLEEEAKTKLSIGTRAKHSFVSQYFETIHNHADMLSKNQTTIDAMKDLSASCNLMEEENEITDDELREMKKSVIDFYETTFLAKYKKESQRAVDIQMLSNDLRRDTIIQQYYYISENPNFLGEKFLLQTAEDRSTYSKQHDKYHPFFRESLTRFDFYDILLIDHKTGKIVYSVMKEVNFGSYLFSPSLQYSHLSKVVEDVSKAPKATQSFVDFENYIASYNLPTFFIATPIYDGEELIGEIVFQLSLERLNKMMTEDIGIGQTGETLLLGTDGLFRSDSLLKPTSHTVSVSFEHPTTYNFKHPALLERFSKPSDELLKIKDYRGEETLITTKIVEIGSLQYLLLAKIDSAEVFLPNKRIQILILIITALLSSIMVSLALRLSSAITKPISTITQRLASISEGNLLLDDLHDLPQNELGELGHAYNNLKQEFQELVSSTQSYTEQLQNTANNLLTAAQKQHTGTTKQASAIEETKNLLVMLLNASQEVTSISQEVFSNADITQKNASLSATQIDDLSGHVEKVGEVLILIKDIATKSDLLALNASLEGTKAGNAGRGFSLVAMQMQKLAEQIMSSAKNIEFLTTDITKSTNASVFTTEEANKLANETTKSAHQITVAAQQQRQGTQEASVALEQIAEATIEVSAAAHFVVEVSAQLITIAGDLEKSIHKFKT